MDELMVELGQLLPAERELGRWVDHLVIDHPTLLPFTHNIPSKGFGRKQ
jgi:hypothetical protein